MADVELLPCPCGAPAKLHPCGSGMGPEDKIVASCVAPECHWSMIGYGQAQVAKRWNRRATAAKDVEAECAQMHDAMRQATERLAAVARECEELRLDAERYRWLRDSDACSLSITHNDHHTVYVSAENTLNDDPTDYYNEVSADERQRMIDRDSIWTLHIYPNTPVGFNVYHAATLDAAIDEARGKEYAA